MKSFTVTKITKVKRHPVYIHNWWQRIINYFRRRRINPIASYELTIEVDSFRKLQLGDVFIGQGRTAWKIVDKRQRPIATGHQDILDVRSWKPVMHCNIIGPAIPVISPSKDWRL
jgi:hypothetical protein